MEIVRGALSRDPWSMGIFWYINYIQSFLIMHNHRRFELLLPRIHPRASHREKGSVNCFLIACKAAHVSILSSLSLLMSVLVLSWGSCCVLASCGQTTSASPMSERFPVGATDLAWVNVRPATAAMYTPGKCSISETATPGYVNWDCSGITYGSSELRSCGLRSHHILRPVVISWLSLRKVSCELFRL
jgi:hypothetical protein